MEPTVLAGAIEFSPAEIALIVTVLAALALLVTAPGWLVLGVVMGRRPGPGTSTGRRWSAGIGGALLGIVLSAGVAMLVGSMLDQLSNGVVPAVLAAWAACWGLAAALHRRPPGRAAPPAPTSPPMGEGWGR